MKKLLAALCMLFVTLSAWAVVNANTATAQQLEALNGIGPVKAKALIDYRTKNGPFKTYADLQKVPGYGPKTLEKLKSELVVGAGTAPAAPAAAAKPAAPAKKP
ncbi:ComEA family DNA-binding protein [Vogesella sp. LIG4]|uniref:ComEA family DNA-binding protein n=1 Tax=Vogesella sp. LIG4 TaxID=1192162 RepID=UPI0008200008|nr:ComEA family DNA-binding protein [Vogesella sp. LIG4]SCK16684.1 competence protein ComEA [Vogesella sp. LIG4]